MKIVTETPNLISEKLLKSCLTDLQTAFYDTPETLFELMFKCIINSNWNEKRLADTTQAAIMTIKKTKITVANILDFELSENPKTNFVMYENRN